MELMPKSSILVSFDHIMFSQALSILFRCSLANFRQACTCAFLNRGTLRALQDSSLLRHGVSNCFFMQLVSCQMSEVKAKAFEALSAYLDTFYICAQFYV